MHISLIHFTVYLKPTQYCKSTIFQINKEIKAFFFQVLGNSLVVWWLGLCASTAGGTGSSPGQGSRFCQKAQPPKKMKIKVLEICSQQCECTEFTLEQHPFQLEVSIYMQIFFNKYSTCIFILQVFNEVFDEVCVRVEIAICRIKRTGS